MTSGHVSEAVVLTNGILSDLPASLYRCIDLKTVSSVVGAVFCESLASKCSAIVNPIEKGHPDLVPQAAANATESQLRNYPTGLEVKATIGNVEQGSNLKAGQQRVSKVTGITWQAHHQEVSDLMGLVWDFCNERTAFKYPAITGVFYSTDLEVNDWGAISGTTGRNTKVCGMKSAGKLKMGTGWIVILDNPEYLEMFKRTLGCNDTPNA